ncbi:MAG TPA: TetR/AcrR family transcriptional regulator [Caulobacteraceae bacterium]
MQGDPPRVRATAKTDTIARLIKAARVEFAAKGVAQAKVESIARAAGVTKQLVYHYYESKEDLFSAVLDDASAQTMPKLVAMSFDHLSPVEALRALLQQVFEQYRSDPLLGPLAREGLRFHEEHRSPRNQFLELIPTLTAKFQAILERGIQTGDFRADVDARASLAIAVLVFTGGFTNRSSMSVILGFDTASEEGMESWLGIASDFVLDALRPSVAKLG